MKTTFEGFVIAVKQQYEVSKNGIYSGFLLNPSPAQLRNLCLLLLENNLSKSDEEIYRVFFQVPEAAALRKAVENFDIEKFKALGNFLRGKSERPNAVSLNLIAILVDYRPRPFNKYLKNNVHSNVAVVSKQKQDFQGIETFFYGLSDSKGDDAVKSISIKQLSRIGVVAILLLAFGYIINHAFFPEKECMQWQKDHYEMVDCKVVNQGIATVNEVVPVNEREINLKKIEVNKETLFFKNGNPQVWYSKIKGKMHYFNANGINPETGKPLKPITDYMIKKYVLK
jgi:hypothetical protein